MKRGVSTALIGGILAVAVILTLFFVTPAGRTITNQILGVNTSFFVPQTNFTPYQGPPFTDNEVKMINSVNAVTCAINSMVKGDYTGRDQTLCKYSGANAIKTTTQLEGPDEPDIRKSDITGLQTVSTGGGRLGNRIEYGESSVTCQESRAEMRAAHPKNASDLADLVIQCWEKMRRNNGANVWCSYVDASNITGLTEWTFNRALDKKGDLGDDLAGASTGFTGTNCTFDLVSENYEWAQSGNGNIGCGIDAGAFVICGNNEGKDEIFLTRDFSTCLPNNYEIAGLRIGINNPFADVETPETLLTPQCTVNNFQLPQTLEGEWRDYMRGYGDPTYVLYYQSFPEGEEDAWVVSPEARYFDAIMILHALPLVGKGIGTAVRLAKGPLTALGMAVKATRIGRLAGALSLASSNIAAWSAARISRLAEATRTIVSSGAKLSSTGQYGLSAADDIATITSKITAAEQVAASGAGRAIASTTARIATEALEAPAARQALATYFSQAVQTFTHSNPASVLRSALGSGGDDLLRAMGTNNVDEVATVVHNLLKAGKTTDEIAAAMKAVGYSDEIANAATAVGHAQQATRAAEAIASNSAIRERLRQYSTLYGAGQTSISTLALIAAQIAYLSESMDKKFLPIGFNTLGMHRPFETPMSTDINNFFFPLIPEAKKKFIALSKDAVNDASNSQSQIGKLLLSQGVTRFYAASPCYADVTFRHGMCECLGVSSVTETHDFGGGATYVKSGTIDRTKSDPFQYAVKECVTPSTTDLLVRRNAFGGEGATLGNVQAQPILKTQCTVAQFELDSSKPQNFCFAGAHIWQKAARYTILAVSIGTSIAATSIGCATGIGCVIGVGVSFLTDLGARALTGVVDETTKWPNH